MTIRNLLDAILDFDFSFLVNLAKIYGYLFVLLTLAGLVWGATCIFKELYPKTYNLLAKMLPILCIALLASPAVWSDDNFTRAIYAFFASLAAGRYAYYKYQLRNEPPPHGNLL